MWFFCLLIVSILGISRLPPTRKTNPFDIYKVDFQQLRADLTEFFTAGAAGVGLEVESFNHHGPFLMRLAWHCTGTYRAIDGRGGCDGAAITKEPVARWGDNAGLPELMIALLPIKNKYPLMSWGDFIVFAGNHANIEMGGPPMKFCGGRVDHTWEEAREDASYYNSGDRRGEGETLTNDFQNLVYVDPNVDGAPEVRKTFAAMGFDDRETVAVIGGGHAFGGCHASRSGFTGYWTSEPNKFTNQFFTELMNNDFFLTKSTKGQPQYNDRKDPPHMMLKTDFAFIQDPEYKKWVEIYAMDYDRIFKDFGETWQDLMNRDFGDKPCLGPEYGSLENIAKPVEIDNQRALNIITKKLRYYFHGLSRYSTGRKHLLKLARLAWRCAASNRITDHRGGCDGLRIRFAPESGFAANVGVGRVLRGLKKYKNIIKAGQLSFADFVVLVGNQAITALGGPQMPFCPGRTDKPDGESVKFLQQVDPMLGKSKDAILEDFKLLKPLTVKEKVALLGVGSSLGLDVANFKTARPAGKFTIKKGDALGSLLRDRDVGGEYAKTAKYLKKNPGVLKVEFGNAWTKLMNADRYWGICDGLIKDYIKFPKPTPCGREELEEYLSAFEEDFSDFEEEQEVMEPIEMLLSKLMSE